MLPRDNQSLETAQGDKARFRYDHRQGFEIVYSSSCTQRVQKATVDRPQGGYGGGSLFTSPDQRCLALHHYSGQGEEGIHIFDTDAELSLVYEQWGRGICSNYLFNSTGNQIYIIRPYFTWRNGQEMIEAAYSNELIGDEHLVLESHRFILPFGVLYIGSLLDNTSESAQIRLMPTIGYLNTVEEPDEDSEEHLNFNMQWTDKKLALHMPWGDVRLSTALSGSIDFKLG